MTATASNYRVRVGDDGATKSTHDDAAEAFAAALDLARTGWSGKAQIHDQRGKLVQFTDGEPSWFDRDWTGPTEAPRKSPNGDRVVRSTIIDAVTAHAVEQATGLLDPTSDIHYEWTCGDDEVTIADAIDSIQEWEHRGAMTTHYLNESVLPVAVDFHRHPRLRKAMIDAYFSTLREVVANGGAK